MKRAAFGFLTAALVLGTASVALADDPAPTLPDSTLTDKPASTGSNDIATGGFVTGAIPADDDPKHATEASIGAGGLFASGNAKTVALTALGKLRVRRDEHQFTMAVAANFARAGKTGEAVETTVENFQGLLRYDYFFTNNFAVFLQTSARNDRFQGLDLRYNLDPGVSYYFINTKKQQLRTEVGYDLQYDVRRDASRLEIQTSTDPTMPAPAPILLDKTNTLHNLRLFAGYDNKLYKEVSLTTGFEFLQNFADAGTYRFVFDIGIKSNVSDNLAIATTYQMRFENKPLPSIEPTDSIASINLVYTLF